MSGTPRRLAVVKLSALGDVVHAMPLAAALRAHWPAARLTWIVERRHAAILRGHVAVDDVVTVDTRAWRRARTPRALRAAVREAAAVRRRLRALGIDVAVDAQGLMKSGAVTWATGAPVRVGFVAARCRERAAALFTTRRVRPSPVAVHVVDQYLELLGPLGVARPARVEFHIPGEERAERAIDEFFAARGLKPRDGLVVLNPGAARPEKRWPVTSFAELAHRLVVEGLRVLVVWGPGEEAGADAIAARGAVVAPPTDLHGLVAVMRRANAVVAGDTGPLHVAAGLGIPCVGLFGPTAAERNGPYGSGHRALKSADGTVASLRVTDVHRAVSEVVA